MVKVVVPVGPTVAGANEQVVLAGTPDVHANVTLPVKPASGVTVMSVEPDYPAVTVIAGGSAARLKLGAGVAAVTLATNPSIPPPIAF